MINTIGQYLIALIPAGSSMVTIVIAAINIAIRCKNAAKQHEETVKRIDGELHETKESLKEAEAREKDYLQAIHSLLSDNNKLHKEIKELTGLIKGVKEE